MNPPLATFIGLIGTTLIGMGAFLITNIQADAGTAATVQSVQSQMSQQNATLLEMNANITKILVHDHIQ